ncbi:YggS family pyridoxal phosphate-dependent enzyme [Campylobacter sp. IFREMER_LSEM_CL1846]|uniref:YggS family pyridoxal phosphate-dependent enzyme n=1 Tax=Campylobacter sp. IFREMER_LSEM_CL1846 TaxID=2911614 RepID=UPI0021E64016|nr:YggS family pyridoxal phosphate-dependent enzyme [Campylobacter sp. IFREMER_LSEM_CL1846]HEC1747946.1 YggS family pyridoxal phosphate-dependent enzyme [Campylobacter lari]MCV3434136.1 YggS family pyridoxal phosphate-dependent enzyme [Campylobacter sp. IFREMER_LSEM_CL1846]HEC1768475.1 YggS family pyridoxal phosphate-dependent enzyme [Campylobacter lari]HEC1789101.1 YggS family pyridoxal phosphate-dependent enzyme [Campylobacter lari]HEC1795829.1 YggS family pyridoxal phosphate-dependent enzym
MNLESIFEKTIKQNVRLVAASKYVQDEQIRELFKQGVVEFGENQVQVLALKKEKLQGLEIKWHFIGNLQSNKINLLIKQNPLLWQSCNGLKIAKAVDKRLDYKLDTLLEINTANESSKSGIEQNKAIEEYLQIQEECKNLNLTGIMCIGSMDEEKVQESFEQTFKIYEILQKHGAKICSMGMSGDFELAIKCGSNMVRLGSILFK